jgi:hypothetical protein
VESVLSFLKVGRAKREGGVQSRMQAQDQMLEISAKELMHRDRGLFATYAFSD